jgi:hypothetical protein
MQQALRSARYQMTPAKAKGRAAADATCAAPSMFRQSCELPMIFSGTKIVSPGRMRVSVKLLLTQLLPIGPEHINFALVAGLCRAARFANTSRGSTRGE